MTIDLSKITLEGSFFEAELPDGSALVVNVVDEDIPSDNGYPSAPVKRVNLTHITLDLDMVHIPCVIGMGADGITVESDYKELYGTVLDGDNMAKCTVEVEEK